MNMSTSLNKLISLYGSQAEAARRMKVGKTQLNNWRRMGYIPLRNAPAIERATRRDHPENPVTFDELYRDWRIVNDDQAKSA